MAQYKFNTKAAKQTQEMNMVDQSNQYGSLKYTQTGTYADGTPKYTATTSLNPQQQALYDQQVANQSQAGKTASNLLNTYDTNYGKSAGIDTSQTANYLFDLGNQRLAPQLEQQRSALETKLANQGITPGSEAYDNAMKLLGQQENDAWNQLYLTGQNQAYNQMANDRASLLGAYGALYGNSAAATPQSGFVSTPNSSVQPVDYTSLVNAYNKAQTDAQNGMLGGIGSLAGDFLGASLPGGSSIGGAMVSSLFPTSDERAKEDIKRVGELDNGIPIHSFRYKWGGPTQIGVLAQEAERTRPEAIHKTSPFWSVDYSQVTR